MPTKTQNPDGTWSEAVPLGPQGRLARLEFWLRDRRRLPRVVKALEWLDEVPLNGTLTRQAREWLANLLLGDRWPSSSARHGALLELIRLQNNEIVRLGAALRAAPMPAPESVLAPEDWHAVYDAWWHARASEEALARHPDL